MSKIGFRKIAPILLKKNKNPWSLSLAPNERQTFIFPAPSRIMFALIHWMAQMGKNGFTIYVCLVFIPRE